MKPKPVANLNTLYWLEAIIKIQFQDQLRFLISLLVRVTVFGFNNFFLSHSFLRLKREKVILLLVYQTKKDVVQQMTNFEITDEWLYFCFKFDFAILLIFNKKLKKSERYK